MADVFISYSKSDRAKVGELVAALSEFGVDLWLDTSMTPDDHWPSEIERQLNASKLVLVCWSRAAVASDWVQKEARGARSRSKQTIPLAIEPPNSFILPLEFEDRHLADISRWNGSIEEESFLKLLSDVGDKLENATLKSHYANWLDKKKRDAEEVKRAETAARIAAETRRRELEEAKAKAQADFDAAKATFIADQKVTFSGLGAAKALSRAKQALSDENARLQILESERASRERVAASALRLRGAGCLAILGSVLALFWIVTLIWLFAGATYGSSIDASSFGSSRC